MIRVAGRPYEATNLWPTHTIEGIIINRLNDDSMVHHYSSLNELEFEVSFRKNIIESAKAMYEGQAAFETFRHSRGNTKYWHITITGGFRLKPNQLPSEAIQDIYINSSLYGFECATAMIIIYYHAALKTIGEQDFNRLFRDLYLYSWHYDNDLRLQIVNTRFFIPGDIVYFKNPDVNPETPWWQGENAVVLEDGKYFGHGLGILTDEQMIHALNRNRSEGSRRSAYLDYNVTRPSFSYLFRVTSLRSIEKKVNFVVHHDEPSISCRQYLYILNQHIMTNGIIKSMMV